MLLVGNHRVFVKEFETRMMVMTAIARAIFERSRPLTDEDAIHPEYREDDQLSGSEVGKFFVGEELVMLFPKGRKCMVHMKPDPVSPKAILFNGDLFDDTYDDRLERYLGRAQLILNRMERVAT